MKSEKLRIGQVATQAGVRIDTVRYYERRGIVAEPERTSSGYREYPRDTVRIIRFIKRSQQLGFSLEEIEELLQLRSDSARDRAVIRAAVGEKIRDIDEKLRQLEAMRGALARLTEACACAEGPLCPILDALDDGSPATLVQLGASKGTPRGSH